MSRFHLDKKEMASEPRKSIGLITLGAIIFAIGIAGAVVYGSIIIENMDETGAIRDQVVTAPGLPPFLMQYIFVGMIVAGLAILGYGISIRH